MFLALDTMSQKKVVLKIVKPNAHQAWVSQFRLEVQVLKRLNHPRIPSLIESHDDWDGCWLVEDYIEAMPLQDWLKTDPGKESRQALFFELLELIHCVHQAGFLYLDLKAENVLVAQDHAYLIDFNACLPIGSVRPILINKDSLPPEGLAGQPMNEKADQIGLGNLYLLFFGPNSIAWSALRENPNERFASLEAFKQAMESSTKRFSLRFLFPTLFGVLAFFSLFISNSSLFSLPSLSLEVEDLKESNPIHELSQANAPSLNQTYSIPSFIQEMQALKASDLCLAALHPQSQSLTPTLWLTYAYVAMHQNHLSLARYLYDHAPIQESSTVKLYCSILGLFLDKIPTGRELSWCVQVLPTQESWLWFLEEFCLHVWHREICLSASDFQDLFMALNQEETLPHTLLEVFMQCVLIGCLQDMSFTLPNRLQEQFKTQIPELYSLYLRCQSSL